MKLTRSLLTFDTETTGVDPCLDRIISLGVSVLHSDGTINPKNWQVLFNPGIPIPAEAIKIHGITDETVKDCKPFSAYAEVLHSKFRDKDILTYNGRRLDLPILSEELRRCGFTLDLSGVRIIDAQSIYFKREPRSLSDAVKRYCGTEHEAAHGAGADAEATLNVLLGQMTAYPDLAEMSIDELATYSRMSEFEPADIAGKLYLDNDGDVRFAFGKNKGRRVRDEIEYSRWMLDKAVGFPNDTLDVIEKEILK